MHQELGNSGQYKICLGDLSPQLRRIRVGIGQHASPQDHGDFLSVNTLDFRLATVDGFHADWLSRSETVTFWKADSGSPQIRQPLYLTNNKGTFDYGKTQYTQP